MAYPQCVYHTDGRYVVVPDAAAHRLLAAAEPGWEAPEGDPPFQFVPSVPVEPVKKKAYAKR